MERPFTRRIVEMAKPGEPGCCCGTNKTHAHDWNEAQGKWVPQTTRRKVVTSRGAQRSTPSASMMSAMPPRRNRPVPLPFATPNSQPISLASRAAATGSAPLIWDDKTRLWVPDKRSGRLLGDTSVLMGGGGGLNSLEDDFDGYDFESWPAGSLHGHAFGAPHWEVIYGENEIAAVSLGGALHQMPLCDDGRGGRLECPADEPGCCRTAASLVVSTTEFGNFDMTVRMRTERRLRVDDPDIERTWEVAWLVWHTDRLFDNGNYFLIDPSGWELGRTNDVVPGDGFEEQTFFNSGDDIRLVFGRIYDLHVRQIDDCISVWVDGVHPVGFRGELDRWILDSDLVDISQPSIDAHTPFFPVSRFGRIGLYSEDAEVYWDDVRAQEIAGVCAR